MGDRNASPSAFGWDFQANAAILLMLENIREADKVRVEGADEDIEITLKDKTKIYSQVKSVIKQDDFSNINEKLTAALETLNLDSQNGDGSLFTYTTNSPNPFNNQKTMWAFTGRTHLDFDELPDSCQKKVQNILAHMGYSHLDTSLMDVHVIPFYGRDLKNRYKEILVARREMLAAEIAHINRKIVTLEAQKKKEQTIVKVQTVIEEFDADISKIHVDAIATQKVIDKLKLERKKLQEEIRRLTKSDNDIVEALHKCISTYAQEFGVSETYVAPQKDYIFTNDLKSLSGTILHKIVFSFKLAYIKLIREKTGLILPILLDSPSGREVKLSTIQDMLRILQRDYGQHQIIIASINDFDMKNKKVIEFKGRLFDDEDIVNFNNEK